MALIDELATLGSQHPHSFASDNWAGAHPDVLAAIAAVNTGYAHAYGDDPVTSRAVASLREHFGADATVHFVANGTGANVLALQTLLRPFEAVIGPDTAHINVDECGAPERAGIKLLTVPAVDGKLTPAALRARATDYGDQHRSQPRVVSISQVTELGTCYQPAEIAELVEIAHELGMYVHVDGSRLCQAAAYLDLTFGELTTALGVDAVSFGGTKNGILYGEAVVLLGRAAVEFGPNVPYLRKSSGQLLSKMRFVAAQFLALLDNDLWRELARHSVTMARQLASEVNGIPGVRVTRPVESNAVFAEVDPPIIAAVTPEFPFYVWDENTNEVRWMTSWRTTSDDITTFASALRTAKTHRRGS